LGSRLSLKVKSFLKVSKKKVKNHSMSKNETFFVRFILLLFGMVSLHAEITVGLLVSIENNAKQTLLYKNGVITCEPFGIIPLEKMAATAPDPKTCQATINTYYLSYPSNRLFARRTLHLQQSYHFERIKGGCVLYANGVESYSEMLLRSGLALMDPAFDNAEWNSKLKKALQRGEKEKMGLHATQIRKVCIKEEK
jgi:hypothetical protein